MIRLTSIPQQYQKKYQRQYRTSKRYKLWIPAFVLILLTMGCSATGLLQRQRITPTPTYVPVPTFTPTAPAPAVPFIIVTPPADGRPGVIIIPPELDPNEVIPVIPSATPTAVPTATPLPTIDIVAATSTAEAAQGTPLPTATPTHTATPTATPTPTTTSTAVPTATPSPFVAVNSGFVTLRSGPSVEYPQIAQLGPDIPIAIVGRNEEGTWYQICCISGDPYWVPAQHVTLFNDAADVPIVRVGPAPTPTPTNTPTETPTITPTPTATLYPFEKVGGPKFFATNNEHLTIWAAFLVGNPADVIQGIPKSELVEAVEGYYLEVRFEGFKRPNGKKEEPSFNHFEFSAPPGHGSRLPYNYKYEYHPPSPTKDEQEDGLTRLDLLGTGTWTIYVKDGTGKQLSNEVVFTTAPDNPHREIYIAWLRFSRSQ